MPNHLSTVLIGTGSMAIEYTRVLDNMIENFEVIGRGKISATNFEKKTNKNIVIGGVENYLTSTDRKPTHAIIAVNVEELAKVTLELLKNDVKYILVEKPAGLDIEELKEIEREAIKKNAHVFVAYNRRFYSSVERAKEIIEEDGGVSSFHFEFTEWAHIISEINQSQKVKEKWFFANSTHVIDLAFFLGGYPTNLYSISKGKGSIHWHPTASVFVGSGITDSGALFSYHSNWESAGRWGIEILTKKRRLLFKPMEQLHVQHIGSVQVEKISINDKLDNDFKPGLYNQVKAFLFGDRKENLLGINEHRKLTEEIYNKMIQSNQIIK